MDKEQFSKLLIEQQERREEASFSYPDHARKSK